MHANDNGLKSSRMCAHVCMNETPRPIQDRFVRVGQIARAGLKGEETRLDPPWDSPRALLSLQQDSLRSSRMMDDVLGIT